MVHYIEGNTGNLRLQDFPADWAGVHPAPGMDRQEHSLPSGPWGEAAGYTPAQLGGKSCSTTLLYLLECNVQLNIIFTLFL